jgi:hypothetical protein
MATRRGADAPEERPIRAGILPNAAFREIVQAASFDQYRLDPRVRVASPDAFLEMQSYVAARYDGVDVEHTFEDPAGRVFDCVPVEQQPSLRGTRAPVAQAPDISPVLQGRPPDTAVPPLSRELANPRRDRHGNEMLAPPGTIPMRRLTLDEVSRFKDLTEFFQKEPVPRPSSKDTSPSAPSTNSSLNHRYAYTQQTVNNIGAHSSLAVYAPPINSDQIFSLSQHWYAGGTGTGHQTVEVGWQVYPAKYGHALPVLFIYYTPDNYATGAYNLDAPGFVQTNNAWTIGGALSPVSTQGGQQMEIDVTFYLNGGNWWLYLGGLTAAHAVGYYPTSLFGTGQMATGASEVLFGGETVTSAVSWPGMGSGANASAGWQQAAYQRNIYYFPSGGGAQWVGLTAQQPSPACYTLTLSAAAAPWGVYFFYGGAGGGDC